MEKIEVDLTKVKNCTTDVLEFYKEFKKFFYKHKNHPKILDYVKEINDFIKTTKFYMEKHS